MSTDDRREACPVCGLAVDVAIGVHSVCRRDPAGGRALAVERKEAAKAKALAAEQRQVRELRRKRQRR